MYTLNVLIKACLAFCSTSDVMQWGLLKQHQRIMTPKSTSQCVMNDPTRGLQPIARRCVLQMQFADSLAAELTICCLSRKPAARAVGELRHENV